MRNKLLIFLLLISSYCFGQTSVPNTDTFSLNDVYTAVHAHTSGTSTNLQSCFDNAIAGYFNATYNTNSYAPANSMLRFRDYKPTGGCTVPTVTTASISSITPYSAYSGGNVSSDGGCTVTERGVCYNTSTLPTISNWHTSDSSGTGSFSSYIDGLSCGTTYYVRAYATNSQGTSYGSEVSFTTSSSALPLFIIAFNVNTSNCGDMLITDLASAKSAIDYIKSCSVTGGNMDGFKANSISVGERMWSSYVACAANNRYWFIYTTGTMFSSSSNYVIVNASLGVIQSVTPYP